MTNTHNTTIMRKLAIIYLISVLFILWVDQKFCHAAEKKKSIPPEEIKISGDLLVSNSKQNYAEFRGNVEAIQGNFIIKSDILRIYYNQDTNIKKETAADKETIKKISSKNRTSIREVILMSTFRFFLSLNCICFHPAVTLK